MCPTEPLWTVCSNNISLKSWRGVFGLPVSICHASHLQEPNPTPGWTLEKTEHGGHCQPGGPGVGQIGAGVARAWLAPKRCWQQIQRSRDQPSYCKVTPPALVLPAARALLGFEDSPKKRPFLMWPLLGTGQGEAGALKLRKHWGHVARSPYNTLHGLSVNSPCNKPNSLYMAKIPTWRKASDLIFMKRSRAWNPTSSHSGLTP